ncbi:MAG: penicillin acylase family protein [Vicinamibacterales bacterium]
MRRIPLRIVAALPILLAAGAIATVLLRFHRPLPGVNGELFVDGTLAPVEILRDRYGIPHVRARSHTDAVFGLGFVHAQDRLWQMEIQRRAAAGRLAEALGPEALPTDRFMRTVGFARAARDARASLDAATLDVIDAYVRGVNAFLDHTSGWRLPVEYSLTGIRPERWTADDVVASIKLLAWAQAMNWREELLYLRLAAKVGANRASELVPGDFDGATVLPAPLSPAASQALDQVARVLERVAPSVSQSAAADFITGGSNAWVLGGARTATGRPILASDPHVAAQAPSTWYLVHLTGGSLDVIGATFPGACAVVIGHNGRVAWGATNAMVDAQDLFVVGYQEPIATTEEVIRIKGGGEERLTVKRSANGPVISELVGERASLALRWTGLDRTDASISAFIALNTASNTADVRAALARVHAPVLGMVYADAGGEIGYAAAGSVPVRGPDGAWTGQFSAETAAAVSDPASGFVVTANNAIGGKAAPMSTSFDLPHRADRITELIEAESAHSIEDVARIQSDVVSRQPKALAPLLFDTVEPPDAQSAAALAMLKAWDGGMRGGSPAAAIFRRYYDEAARAILRDELGDRLWADYEAGTVTLARAMHRFAKTGAGAWCDDVELPGQQTCGVVLGAALRRSVAALTEEQGGHMQAWRWDARNTVRFPHAPLDAVVWLRPIFSRALSRPGDGFTVNPAMRIRGQVFVASYRQIIDVGDWDNSRFIMPMGQSGHPISGHYDDMLPLWNEGRYVPMAFSEGAVRAAAWRSLTLRPRPRAGPSSSADTPREK